MARKRRTKTYKTKAMDWSKFPGASAEKPKTGKTWVHGYYVKGHNRKKRTK